MKNRRCSRVHAVLRNALYVTYLAGVCWLGIQAFFWLRFDVSVTQNVGAAEIWQYYYPELHRSGVKAARISRDDGHYDVLLLGASVLEQVAERLESGLRDRRGERLRVFNLCRAAHTSRDSYLKFSRLVDKDFDLIIVYHGINDARMNCCPAADFRDDYLHCAHYESLKRRLAAGKMTFKDVADDEVGRLISLGSPEPELLEFGRTIKTAQPFRKNIESIVEASRAKDRPVVLMTFAFHLPADYTPERFEKRRLDYGRGAHELPAELWGKPEHLRPTIAAHNRVIRQLAAEFDNVILVDQFKLLPPGGRYFSDPCHLTDDGCRKFVANLMPAIDAALIDEQIQPR